MSYNLSYDIRGYWFNSFLNDMVIFKLLLSGKPFPHIKVKG